MFCNVNIENMPLNSLNSKAQTHKCTPEM